MASKVHGPTEPITRDDTLEVEQASSSRRRPFTSPNRAAVYHQPPAVKVQEEDEVTDQDTDSGSDNAENDHQLAPTSMRRGTISKSYSTAEERIVIRKLDRRLTLFLTLLYLLSFLDRSNIGNARVAGLQSSLGITSSQFDLTLLAFYVTYITFEWMILLYRLVPPHIYIASCVFSWGLVACLQSTVTSFTQLLVLRAVLGVTEAAFGPGVPFYMTFFYRREELAYRVGLQISAAPLATSFASSLAWVIVKLSENGPLDSWRALFLIEGFPSIIAAVFAFYVIPDSPGHAQWLTPRERKIAILRLQDSSSPSPHTDRRADTKPSVSTVTSKLNTADLLTTLRDPKAWLTSLMFLSVNVSFASLPVFLPTIINDMSFSALTSQILAAPPYLFAFAFVLLISRASDRIADSRGLFLTGCAALSATSYAAIAVVGALSAAGTVGVTTSIVLRYIAVYGAAMGLFSSVVLIITWQLNNQQSTAGKGLAMVILNVVGQTGPLIGVKLFPGGDSPYFVRGMSVCAGFMGAVALLAAALRLYLGALNVRLKQKGGFEMVRLRGGEDGAGGGGGGGSGDDEEAEGLMGGRDVGSHPESSAKVFTYML